MIQEFPGIVSVAVHRVLPTHLHVAAERDGIDAIVGLALAEADQTLTKADGELLHPHTQQLGHRIVAELVDEDHGMPAQRLADAVGENVSRPHQQQQIKKEESPAPLLAQLHQRRHRQSDVSEGKRRDQGGRKSGAEIFFSHRQ